MEKLDEVVNSKIERPCRRKKGLLKTALIVKRNDRSKLRALAESLRQEFAPQNPFEEFIFEKLLVDFGRLAKLYEYENKHLFPKEEYVLNNYIAEGRADRFLRYKNSIEKDIKDGYARLEELKEMRNSY